MVRRRVLVVAGLAVGVTLLILGRPGSDDSGPGPATRPPAGADPPAAQAPPGDPHRSATNPPEGGTPDPAGSASPSRLPPLVPHDDSGVAGEETLAAEAVAGAVTAAEQFAAIWAYPDPNWYDRLSPLATPALAGALADAEPPRPPPELTGAGGRVLLDAPAWARVGVPARQGTLVLDVVIRDGRWLVAAVDWRPA